jgi:hypothetical protein
MPEIDDGIKAALDDARAVDRRDVIGGPARNRVVAAIAAAEQRLNR